VKRWVCYRRILIWRDSEPPVYRYHWANREFWADLDEIASEHDTEEEAIQVSKELNIVFGVMES